MFALLLNEDLQIDDVNVGRRRDLEQCPFAFYEVPESKQSVIRHRGVRIVSRGDARYGCLWLCLGWRYMVTRRTGGGNAVEWYAAFFALFELSAQIMERSLTLTRARKRCIRKKLPGDIALCSLGSTGSTVVRSLLYRSL
jgi:hypothetical protein